MATKRQREVDALIDKAGLVRVNPFVTSGSGHIRMLLQAPDGATQRFDVSSTPSDGGHSDLNQLSWFRKFAREHPAAPAMAAAFQDAGIKPPSPPPEPEDMTKHTAPGPVTTTRPRPPLTPAQTFQLTLWVSKTEITQVHSITALAILANEAEELAGFVVNEQDCETALGAVGKTLTPRDLSEKEKQHMLAFHLCKLMTELGHKDTDPRLTAMAREHEATH